MPSVDEVKKVVFNLSGSSASGPDGFPGIFYQTYWDIISLDVYKMVVAFFPGHTLPKLETVLPQLISINQASFVQGSSIIENVLLAQGIAKGFFHSTRGVKQGDTLSPVLFILSAEVLSRALNAEFDNAEYVGYGMPEWSQNINRLAYADDTIIFASAEGESLKRIMKILQEYEAISGQLINKGKSAFYMHHNISGALRKKVYYNDLIKKVKNKLQNWKGKLLSFGGKAVRINSVLQSIPIYMLSAVVPTKYTINELHKIFESFYWSTNEEGKSRHWSSWDKVCLPKEEGGLGFRSLDDVSKAFFSKLWWKFRTSNTLWSAFMWNKYCKKKKPTEVQWKG
ncbi:uncharacterized protein LOC132611981 [Lycium barbarum]|uniref:uncharacterized protein LOC132611981 n=1 Tax=Lycium barbarum TaxID=112863 RepID=UPI00293F0536|nr:uncharacterized protein LOC132611981 [Lycium barbarum]